MFETIKLNKGYWKKIFPKLKYGVPDPLNVFSEDKEKFSEAMTTFGFSGVYKTTRAGRHAQTQALIKDCVEQFSTPVAILDIGASDGSTSLDLVNLLQEHFKKYYVTDYNIKCSYVKDKGYTYFFGQDNECLLVASSKFVFYPGNKKIFDRLFKKSLNRIKDIPRQELLLINKELQQKQQRNSNIVIMQHNVFEPWQNEKLELVIVGNLLNRSYFSDSQIASAVKNCYASLTGDGYLTVIRNTLTEDGNELERSTIYRKNNTDRVLEKYREVNGGIEVNDLLLSLKF